MIRPLSELGRSITVAAFAFFLVTTVGCSCNSITHVQVSGLATHQGMAVPNLIIFFQEAEGLRYWGTTDDEGRFTLTGEHGKPQVPRGSYQVWVSYDPNPADPMAMIAGVPPPKDPPGLKLILSKYGKREASPLKIDVTGSVNDLVLALD